MDPLHPTAVYALTRRGLDLARTIPKAIPADVYAPASLSAADEFAFPDSLPLTVAHTFARYPRHIFVTAAGIAVRCIAPLLRDKTVDPAVIVLDQRGRFVISLLSGHLGGANDLARQVAAVTGGTAVITTATDVEDLPSMDLLAAGANLSIANIRAVAGINAALLDGRTVQVDDPQDLLGLRHCPWSGLFCFGRPSGQGDLPLVRVTDRAPDPPEAAAGVLYLHPKTLHLGVGCRKGTPGEAIVRAVTGTLDRTGLALASVAALASVDIKRDEAGLLEAARSLGLPLVFFTPDQLAAIPASSPSAKAREVLGIDGVCEAAAVLSVGDGAELAVPKQIADGVTVAVARRKTA